MPHQRFRLQARRQPGHPYAGKFQSAAGPQNLFLAIDKLLRISSRPGCFLISLLTATVLDPFRSLKFELFPVRRIKAPDKKRFRYHDNRQLSLRQYVNRD